MEIPSAISVEIRWALQLCKLKQAALGICSDCGLMKMPTLSPI
jgi:hypothetical protein